MIEVVENYTYLAQETKFFRILETLGLKYVEEMLNPGLEFEKVHVISLYDNFNYENLDLGSLIVHPIRRRQFFRILLYPFNEILGISLHVFKIIRKHKIKLIWSVGGSLHDNGAVALIAGKLARIPAVVSVMNNYDMKYLHYPDYFLHNVFLNEAWERIILRNATRVRVISEDLIRYAIRHGVPSERVVYIPRKVKLEAFGKSSESELSGIEKKLGIENKKKILFVGRLTPQKNVQTMLRAISMIAESHRKDFIFLIAGDGPLMESLRKITKEMKLQEYVYFLGRIPHTYLRHIYTLSDIFLFTTLFEGLGRVILEAMASGLPIVTSNQGPVTELVKHKRNGLLVHPDEPEEIAHAILCLLGDKNLRLEFGKRSRIFAENYSFSCINRIEIEFIKKIIAEYNV